MRREPAGPWSCAPGLCACFPAPPTTETVPGTQGTLAGLLSELVNTPGSPPLCSGRAVRRSQPRSHSSLCPQTQTSEVAPSPWFSKCSSPNTSRSTQEPVIMQTARSRCRPTESGPLGVRPAIWILTNPPELDAHSTLQNCSSNHDDLEPYGSNPWELRVQPKGLPEGH